MEAAGVAVSGERGLGPGVLVEGGHWGGGPGWDGPEVDHASSLPCPSAPQEAAPDIVVPQH